MPYRFLDNIAMADVAFEAWGETLREMLMSACNATENIMLENLQSISPVETKHLHIKESSLEMIVFRMIEELIFFKDSEKLFLLPFDILIKEENSSFFIDAILKGEKINPDKHNLGVDIKGITLYRFKVKKTDNQWKATIILDV